MSSISKSPKGYRAQIYVKGVRESATFATKREATNWSAMRETEIRAQSIASPVEKFTLVDALRKYGEEVSPTHRGCRWEEIRIISMSRDSALPTKKLIHDLTPDDFGQWRNHRMKSVTSGTVIRELGFLSAVMEQARREWRWIDTNPMKDVKKPAEPDHREVIITRAQVRLMLKTMHYHRGECRNVTQALSVAFLLALHTGMRQGEICEIPWDRVHSDYCMVDGKTGKRNVPLTFQARRLIESMRGYDPVRVFGLNSNSMSALFRKYRQRAGLDGFTFHDSRHTAATRLAQKIHVLDLCKMFGWSNPQMAMTYYNPTASDIAKRISRSTGLSR